MHDNVAGFLESAFYEVLANYAFLFGERTQEYNHTDEGNREYIHAWIDILSDDKSKLGVIVPIELARIISGNVIGVDENDPLAIERAEDAVKEMVNVLCGHLRTILTYENCQFEASIPSSQIIDQTEWKEYQEKDETLTILIEEYPLLLILSIDGKKT